MNRNQITAGAIVRTRPTGRHNWGYNIGRIVSDTPVSMRTIGYYGKQTPIINVEWYATLSEDGTIRVWEEPRIEQAMSRTLEIIDIEALANELRTNHDYRQAQRDAANERHEQTREGLATLRAALGSETWGAQYEHGRIRLDGHEVDALVAFVSKVVAS